MHGVYGEVPGSPYRSAGGPLGQKRVTIHALRNTALSGIETSRHVDRHGIKLKTLADTPTPRSSLNAAYAKPEGIGNAAVTRPVGAEPKHGRNADGDARAHPVNYKRAQEIEWMTTDLFNVRGLCFGLRELSF